MPSKALSATRSHTRPKPGAVPKSSDRATRPRTNNRAHIFFYPIVVFSLIVWVLYRSQLQFPVWFDETIGKAVFFALPVWLYVSVSSSSVVPESFGLSKLKKGLLLGIAFGGMYGFAATVLAAMRPGSHVETAALFSSDAFWVEFMLALFTGFWETLFFYSFVMTVVEEKYPQWSLVQQIFLTVTIFMVFHLPNTLLRFSLDMVPGQFLLLTFFALGQAFLFARRHNGYALAISHAIWGMVLLVHLR